jgi:hypothetical protein
VSAQDTIVFLIVVGLRFGIPLLIPRFPLPAIVAALVLDAADQTIFQQFTDIDTTETGSYQSYDKALDIYYLTIAYVSTMRNWGGGIAFSVARFLWYYRLVGVVLFESLGYRWLLLVFPNTFEYYFIAIEAYKLSRNHLKLSNKTIITIAAAIWIFIKLPQEYWIHVAKLDFTNFMKHTVFGLESTGTDPRNGADLYDQGWGEAISNRPLVAIGLVVLIVALLALIRTLLRKLPPRDWERTIDADVQGRHLGWEPPAERAEPTAAFGWPFAEKVALTSMIAIIFSHVLPGVEASPLQIVISVAVVIAALTLVSEWLARREVSWRSTGTQFVTMSVLGLGLTILYWALLGGDDDQLRLGNTLFFVLLLTLVMVLFDRYRHIGVEHQRLRGWRRERSAV